VDHAGDTMPGTAPPPSVGPSSSRASVPPSEPRSPSRTSFSQIDLSADRPARLQMIVALVLGLVLVAIPLYLWRRPRAESIPTSTAVDASAEAEMTASTAAAATPPPDEGKVILGEPKTVLCQDPGPKKTAPADCDHLVDVEKAFAKAIEDAASCVPEDSGGGTIQYVADVSFKHKALNVAAPRDGRTVKGSKVASSCQAAVKSRLRELSLEPIAHAHARYKISITASYPAAAK
jgi:hypothetical protein